MELIICVGDVKMGNKNIDVPETHQKGFLSIEKDFKSGICDVGIMVKDGRIWICVDGIAFIRFRPLNEKMLRILGATNEE